MSAVSFDYGVTRVNEIQAITRKTEEGKQIVDALVIGDEKVKPTKRFWTSLQTRFGFSKNIFRYFDHKEVFDRVSQRAKTNQIRYCIERGDGRAALLGVTNPNAPVIKHGSVMDLLGRYGTKGVTYSNGVVTSRHEPRVGAEPFKIVGDTFQNQFVIDTPVDGYGHPSVYLSMMRLVCANGAIAYARAFRSELAVGKTDEDIAYNLIRAMDGFNNEEGYGALASRFEASQRSWASVRECNRLYKLLAGISLKGQLRKTGGETVLMHDGSSELVGTDLPVLHRFHRMTGDLNGIYNQANLETLSTKKQRVLPAACRVYDVLNFTSEVATHYADATGARKLQAMVGELIGAEYDLEGTAEKYADFRDFFVGDAQAAEAKASLERRGNNGF